MYSLHKRRANQTCQWCVMDIQEKYLPIQLDSRPNYSRDAFDYKFNSDGFRSEELTTKSDLPILFMGCSFTEGIGLPREETWPIYLLDKIKKYKQHTGKSIPHLSIALGGTGVDTMAREFEEHCSKVRPKYAFYLLGSFYRREFLYNSNILRQYVPSHKPADEPKELRKIFSEVNFAWYQSYRSLCLINAVAQLYGTEVFIYTLFGDDEFPKFDREFSNIKCIEQVNLTGILSVDEKETFKDKLKKARDNVHDGAEWQFSVAKAVEKHLSSLSVYKDDFRDSTENDLE